ncbi:hypothetical protein [Flavobacterium sp. WC2509]|uniref:hypothetical protein n=1 Tax=Flavobacterium sp. WC2509 TaxID=3461406 RepID=UPI004043DEED
MINKKNILNLLPYCIMLITLNSHGSTMQLGNTTFWWGIQFFMLFLFWEIKKKYTSKLYNTQLYFLNIYVLYVLISFVRGIFIIDGYWDWKNLISNTMCLLIPIVVFAMESKFLLQYLIKKYIFYTAPLFLIVQFFIGKDEFGFYLAPFSFLLIFLPILSKKWILILLAIATYVILADFGARSNLIKFIIPIIMSLIYYFRKIFSVKMFEFLRIILIVLPFLFFTLAVSASYNIFNPKGDKHKAFIDKKRDSNGNIIEEDLMADTRTALYVDVLVTAEKYNSWVFGRSPARGNISDSFGEIDMNKRNERNGNEVSILNYFIWLGLAGVVLIFILFYQASYLAINKSNNIFSKIMGLFIAFRWTYAWVEDINNFYIQYVVLWFFIGFCYSKSFREMTDSQMKYWVMGIFEKQKRVTRKMMYNLPNQTFK